MSHATPSKRRKHAAAVVSSTSGTSSAEGSDRAAPVAPPAPANAPPPRKKTAELVRPPRLGHARLTLSPRKTPSDAGRRTKRTAAGADAEKEQRRAALEALVAALREDVRELEADVERERRRRDQPPPQDGEDATDEAMISRLLAANDTSFADLPPRPTFTFDGEAADPALPSTLPQPSTLAELSAFSHLCFTSFTTPSLVSSASSSAADADAEPVQHHELAGHALARRLFFRVSAAVALHSLTVRSVAATLSPWARRELAPALHRFADARDLSATLYAVNSYAALAEQRAAAFARLAAAFPRLLSPASSRLRRTPRAAPPPPKEPRPARRDVTAHLGAAVLRFRDLAKARQAAGARSRSSGGGGAIGAGGEPGKECGEVEFVLDWSIAVDDVGEAHSTVRGEARVPAHWSDADRAGCFRTVGATFDGLVLQRGVFEAAKCVAGLLWPEVEP